MSQLQLPDPHSDVGKALSFPVGMASPLWVAYAGAAAAGAAFWWMSRWVRPTNLEALVGLPTEAVETVAAVAEEISETVEAATAEAVVEAAPVIQPMSEGILPGPLPEPEPAAQPAPETVLEAAPEIAPEPAPVLADDLTRIVGIGPKLSVALAERGLTTFAKLATLEAADLEALDRDLDLKGRAVRDAWVAQAARFAQLH